MKDDKLADVFGEDFAGQYKETVEERRRQREKVEDEVKKVIAHEAINEDQMQSGGDEPHFTFTTDEGVTHDVILATLPDPDGNPIWSHMNELDSGAVTIPVDYLGQWMSCLFNDPEDLKMMEPGEMYILIGNMDTWQPEDGEPRDQMSPVRGVLDLETANEYAREMMEEQGISSPSTSDESEDEEDDGGSPFSSDEEEDGDEDDGDDSSGGMFSSSGDDDEDGEEDDDDVEVSKSEVEAVIHDTADNHPEIWDVEGSGDRLDKVTQLVAGKLDYDDTNEVINQIEYHSLEVIQEYNEDDEDDDEEDALF